MRLFFELRLLAFFLTFKISVGVNFQLVENYVEAVSEYQIGAGTCLHCAALCARTVTCKVFRYTGFNQTCGFPTVNLDKASEPKSRYSSSSLTTSTYVKQCPEGWTRLRYSCYMVNKSKRLFWSDASNYCVAEGGHLAVITSQWEQDSVVAAFNDTESKSTWLGGYYENNTSSWRWVTGETWNFTIFDNPYNDIVPTTDSYLGMRSLKKDAERKWRWLSNGMVNRTVVCERIL